MRIAAQILSILLYPMLIPTYAVGLACLAVHHYTLPLPPAYVAVALIGTFFLTCCIPLSVILLLIKQKAITDIYLRNPQERHTPYLYSFFACCFWCYFLHDPLHLPHIIIALAIASTLVLLVVMIITRWWKISAHLAFIGSLLAAVIAYSWYISINPLWIITTLLILTLLLMYARIYLKQHTTAQVLAGFTLGFTLTLIPAFII